MGSSKSPLDLVLETDSERTELLEKEKELVGTDRELELTQVY